MVYRKSKSSKSIEKPGIDPIQAQDDLEQDIQNVIYEDQIDLMEKLEPIFTVVRMQLNNGNTRDDVARKYEAFLKSVSQVMKTNNIISINVGHFIDPHSYNSLNYADLELTSDGVFANHCDGTVAVENVLEVLSDLEEPKQILRSLINQIVEKMDIRKNTNCKKETLHRYPKRSYQRS